MPNKKPPMVEIEWEDSVGSGGWFVPHEMDDFVADTAEQKALCRSIGYLWKRDGKHLVIVQSIHTNNAGAPLSIPTRMVRKVSRLA